MKASFVYFAVICVFVHYANAQDTTSVDCTKKPRHVPPHMCCPVPDLTTDELMQKCAQFAGPPPPRPPSSEEPPMRGHPHPHGPHMHPCFMECIFNQTEVIGEDGELNADKFEQLLNTVVKDDREMAIIMKESFNACSANANELKTKIAEEIEKNPEFSKQKFQPLCSPFSAMTMGCIKMQTFQNCPSSTWNDNEECNAFRKFIMECKKPK
ncbi:general odorant-binding protein 68 [Rhagoletis pomonella]|uniref:general odorant-binding protein 68 n=1 Tax=Rhagoletis pomonella TaxID=28610 RepID=UPI00177B69BF|nr:general odorant-binding protein 68 [Rhagoletis pomonella]